MTFRGIELEIALDMAEGLGEFVEIEALPPVRPTWTGAQPAVLALAG